MSRKVWLLVLAVALATAACSRLGTGLPGCETPSNDPNAATVLSLQAVPSAHYSPCLNNLRLGWDEVEFEAASGLVRLEFEHGIESFLDVRLTESCDVGDAVEVASGLRDIRRFENVSDMTGTIRITIVPDGERPLIHALGIADRLEGVRIEDRPVAVSVDEDVRTSVRSRVNRALMVDDYVWIIGDLDIDEDTLEMRATPDGEGLRGIEVDDALDVIEESVEDMSYQGNWFFVFEGGCITYEFEAEGRLAATVAADAEEAIGFYHNEPLREAARRFGYDLGDE